MKVVNTENRHLLKYTLLSVGCILLVSMICWILGFLPFPHTSLRSPEVSGRVLDAKTHVPIQGAKVFLTEHPEVSCLTDSAGSFVLKETRNLHLGIIIPEKDWPDKQYWTVSVSVSKANYEDYVQHGLDDWRLKDKGDILLEPNK